MEGITISINSYGILIIVLIFLSLVAIWNYKSSLVVINMFASSFKIFINHKLIFLQNFIFIIFANLLIPIILIALIYIVPIFLSSISEMFTSRFLINAIAIFSFFWIIISIAFFALSVGLFGTFSYVIFYRQLFQSVVKDNEGDFKKLSFMNIFFDELRNFPRLFKLVIAMSLAKLQARLQLNYMMINFWHRDGEFDIKRYLAPSLINQIFAYVPIDYALYKSSPRRAVFKSYDINKNWTIFTFYGSIISTILGIFNFILVLYLILIANTIETPAIWFELENSIGGGFSTVSAMVLLVLLCLTVAAPVGMLMNTFAFMVYLNYNNSLIEGVVDNKFGNFETFESFLEYFNDFITERFGTRTGGDYEKYTPLKDNYLNLTKL